MDIHELKHQAKINESKTLKIYNPDTADFTVKYHGEPYTVHALEMESFPLPIANHIKKHLADHLLNKRGIKSNPQDDLVKYLKEIEVSIE